MRKYCGAEDLKKALRGIGLKTPSDAKEKQVKLEVFKEDVSLEEFKKTVEVYQFTNFEY